ncbi:hypothetical protein RhiirA4_509173 [Rhizophagus irregularis]|uniref:Protein kinase domain-containing protein n=1 Tax=Rhizophagus irregularis TaxID=588596 RepID=A0A2I1HE41_9GLOM|nr:hypothetical protein RhiirA4_509173 [Rhizophagus irregularis]
MEFVPYDQFKNIEFIAEGGFSKIYKATWVDGPIKNWRHIKQDNIFRNNSYTVVLKKLHNSKNITQKEKNELSLLIWIIFRKTAVQMAIDKEDFRISFTEESHRLEKSQNDNNEDYPQRSIKKTFSSGLLRSAEKGDHPFLKKPNSDIINVVIYISETHF